MRPSSSRSDDPFGFLVATGPVAASTTTGAWVAALLEVEAALAGAHADAGDIPADSAERVVRACATESVDLDALGAEAARGGNLVIPLVERLRIAVGSADAASVHRGATSQDVMDAATALVLRRCAELVTADLETAGGTVADLAAAHGHVPMIARTLGRHAVATTFSTVTARWADGLAAATAAVTGAARRPVGLGGPSGDGTSFGPTGAVVLQRFAARLDLSPAPLARHAQRSDSAAFAGAWGLAAAAVAKIALDVVLLAQDDVGELAEVADGAGGSSSMPHKRNAVAAISARAAAMQVPGQVATMLHAAGSAEWERAAGAWHAEWPATNGILRATGSAVHWLGRSLDRLVVDPDRMAANLTRRQEAP